MTASPTDWAARSRADANALLDIVRAQARRPFFAELTGTPKAGKTTVIALLDEFFRDAGYEVHVLRERAELCPLKMKGHFFFNTWTTAAMMAALLELVDTDHDIVIVDRGFFDALMWLELQTRRNQVTPEERAVFEQFVLLGRWRTLVDVTFVLTAEPHLALQREDAIRGEHRRGSLMNEPSLNLINESLQATLARVEDQFDIRRISTDLGTAQDVANEVIGGLLQSIRSVIDPQVVHVPRIDVHELFDRRVGFLPWSPDVWARLVTHASTGVRSEIEPRGDVVQLVACGIATHERGLLVLQRDPADVHHDAYGAGVIWQGIHVEHDADAPIDISTVQHCVGRRFKDDLHLAMPPPAEPRCIGLVWDPGASGGRHLGIVFPIEIPDAVTADHLEGKTFKTRGRRPPQVGKFVPSVDLRARPDDYALESWSRAILTSGWPTT